MKTLPGQTPAMARTFLMVVAVLAALGGMAWPVDSVGQGISASVLSIGDGDTIRVNQDRRTVTVRLACIDAPETAQGESGAVATQMLKQLLASGPLEIRPQTVDRYGRTVAEVYAGGRNVNLEMVRLGAAYAYRQYLSGCDESAYLSAEGQAERYRQGVWRWGNEVKPWDFRKNR
jgi:micrococcal nuclease